MANTTKILFFGDIVGKPGRGAVKAFSESFKDADFIVANVENASHGFGLTEKNYEELAECGIDCMTAGNHIWDKKDIFGFIEGADRLVRPANYPEGTPGVGYRIFDVNSVKIGVINLLGRNFMPVINSPVDVAEKIISEIKKITPIIFVDFHAEATAEKICIAKYFASLGVSAFAGTHTHVQTADEQIIDGTCGYITDAGFCGDYSGVIGMDYEISFRKMKSMLPERYEVASSGLNQVNAVLFEIETATGKALDVKRIFVKDI